MKCCDTKPSDLKHRISVLVSSVVSTDGIGGRRLEWNNASNTMASVSFSSLRDKDTGRVLVASGSATMIVRSVIIIPDGARVEIMGEAQYKVIGSDPLAIGDRFRKHYLEKIETEEA